ncbi:hypothetical protein [Bradyrhizobium sp. AC87j1]|uniref:hypothetical protein n=1 Tax=Bradyrhizobium sp. AC87j1 TaxID=2055894 RepID=UPI0011B0D588|nr:hypothetical protein [Bradyrhizobium sp. AC87j1]
MRKVIFYLGFGAVALFLIVELVPIISNDGCEQRWKKAGFSARYVIGSGCTVNVDGRWELEGNLRINVIERPR